MNKTALAIIAALSTSIALADDFKTINGKEYKNVTVSKEEPDGITVTDHKSVLVKLDFTELPKEVQERFHYDAANGDAYSGKQNEALEQFQKQQEALQRKLTEGKSKNGTEGESVGQKRWISGKIISKSNDALLIECSRDGVDGYEAATGHIVLRNHPNFAMLAEGDRVAVFAVATSATQWGGPGNAYLHAYRVPLSSVGH